MHDLALSFLYFLQSLTLWFVNGLGIVGFIVSILGLGLTVLGFAGTIVGLRWTWKQAKAAEKEARAASKNALLTSKAVLAATQHIARQDLFATATLISQEILELDASGNLRVREYSIQILGRIGTHLAQLEGLIEHEPTSYVPDQFGERAETLRAMTLEVKDAVARDSYGKISPHTSELVKLLGQLCGDISKYETMSKFATATDVGEHNGNF